MDRKDQQGLFTDEFTYFLRKLVTQQSSKSKKGMKDQFEAKVVKERVY